MRQCVGVIDDNYKYRRVASYNNVTRHRKCCCGRVGSFSSVSLGGVKEIKEGLGLCEFLLDDQVHLLPLLDFHEGQRVTK